jgi:aspartyl protease family protein
MNKLAALAFASFAAASACAQGVLLQGMLGSKALLVVDGGAPRIVAPGETVGRVKVVSTSGDTAVIEIDGRRQTLRIGEAPVSVGSSAPAPGSGSRIVLNAGSGGHFMTEGRINDQQVRFMVDTGATTVAMSEAEARRIGLKYKEGRIAMVATANGPVTTWLVKLSSVRVGDVEVREVDANVVPAPMPYILLGNSFLNRFQMKRENDLMVLERRY